MKTNEVVFILDESGSMSGLVDDTIGGFNSVLKEQKENTEDGEVLVSAVAFNTESRVIYDRESIGDIKDMTRNDYKPIGGTALIDALGESIKHIKNVHKYIRKEDIPEHTLFVIITDGMENSSRKYSSKEVKDMINEQEKNANWEFMFIGANIDAVETAKRYGIREDYAFDYLSDSIGTANVFSGVSGKIFSTRKCCASKKSSNKAMCKVTADFEKRRKK